MMEYEVTLAVKVHDEFMGEIDKTSIRFSLMNLFECVDLKGVHDVEIKNVKRCN